MYCQQSGFEAYLPAWMPLTFQQTTKKNRKSRKSKTVSQERSTSAYYKNGL